MTAIKETLMSCPNAVHQFERVGYRVPEDAVPGTSWVAVLVCLRCGDVLTTPVDATREAVKI
ncbi:MAG: hypothetical protein V3R16_09680 [Nitrospirales bacterium]